jgi:flagellar biosynthesis/type III secretory pathway chaperone
MQDQTILQQIEKLVQEEHELLSGSQPPEEKAQRLKHVGEQLDQCWDLLRQRRAKREFGEDPDSASVRDVGTVERYTG